MRQRDYQAGALYDQAEAQREALVDFEATNDGLDGGELPDHPGYYPQYEMTAPGSFYLPDGPTYEIPRDMKVGEQYCAVCGDRLDAGYHTCPILAAQRDTTLGPESDHAEALRINAYCDPVGGIIPQAQCRRCGDVAAASHQCLRNDASAVAAGRAETVGTVASSVKQHSPVDPHLSSSTAQRGDDTSSAGASSPQAPAELPTTTVVPSTVTRVVLVHKDGFTERWAESWDMHVQDEGRTLKLFPRTETAPRYEYTPGFFDFPSTTK
jgi:hypothetical protein